jgi:hypothetical protein
MTPFETAISLMASAPRDNTSSLIPALESSPLSEALFKAEIKDAIDIVEAFYFLYKLSIK